VKPLDLPVDLEDVLTAFRARHGRTPRVLHIGNIANNAFYNASLLRKAGLECDVICYNYYHVMSCPEWEEADFDGTPPGDASAPRWYELSLGPYRRPRWFAQGPQPLCLDYLAARAAQSRTRAELLWRVLEIANRTASPMRLVAAVDQGWYFASKLQQIVSDPQAAAALRRRLFGKLQRIVSHPEPAVSLRRRLLPLERRIGRWAAALSLRAALMLLAVMRWLVVCCIRLAPDTLERTVQESGNAIGELAAATAAANQLVARFRAEFPERVDSLTETDLRTYEWNYARWKALLPHYDLIIGYSTDPAWVLMAGVPYFALEHGTLREIPFAPTPQGRCTALAYRLAEHVFVTNHDCLPNAHALAGDRVTFINHPYDEDRGLQVTGWEALRKELACALDADFLVFAPTRHDWVPGTGYADKANDVLIRAFCMLRRSGQRVGIIFCDWGANVDQSKALLRDAGCNSHVRWVAPMGLVHFQRTARACHVVADQFKLGAFGGIMFKALAVGAPVLTYLDDAPLRAHYPEPPPVVNCHSENEIVATISDLIAHPARLETLSRASRGWIKTYHAGSQTVAMQLRVFAHWLELRAQGVQGQ